MSQAQKDPAAYVEHLDKVVHEIHPRRLGALAALESAMADRECFDDDDWTYLRTHLTKASEEYEQDKQRWTVANHLLNHTLAEMEQTVSERDRLLNQVNQETGLFELHPVLTKRFASKQAELNKAYQLAKEKIFE